MANEKKGPKLARVIFAGTFGKVGDVIEVTEQQAKAGVASGDLDDTPEAVAYAKAELDKHAKQATADDKPLEE